MRLIKKGESENIQPALLHYSGDMETVKLLADNWSLMLECMKSKKLYHARTNCCIKIHFQ